ncbi:MAG: metalloregulator ArsR/SmtB family transcription factor [Lachnospiraceae bacterium]|nr:metalloregulator ArsR/SmtB family transcription factor [Lachnospiraceae bacterium]
MDEHINDLAELFKVFGDPTRLKILNELLDGEKNVSELGEKLSMNQSAISHQLRLLKASDLVKVRRDGKSMFYSLADDHVKYIFEIGMEHILEED